MSTVVTAALFVLSVSKLKAAIKRAQRKFTCKLHSEREQVQAHEVGLKVKSEKSIKRTNTQIALGQKIERDFWFVY